MARIRSIKPDFWTDEKVVELSAFGRLLFIGLWNFADDEGRMVFSEKKIKMQIFPSDTLDMSGLFGEIRREKMIEVYSIDNVEYLQIVGFSKHQKIDRRQKSKLPPNSSTPADLPRFSTTDQGMDQGREKKEEAVAGATNESFDSPVDFKKNLFTDGLKLIGGESKRSLLGKWLRDYGEGNVIAAILSCQKNSAVDPIPYIEKTLKEKTNATNFRNNQSKPTWKSEGERLTAKYAAEAEREEQAGIIPIAEPGLRPAKAIRQDTGGA